jgi:hypothetical protein
LADLTPKDLQDLGWPEDFVRRHSEPRDAGLADAEGQLAESNENARAYAGWLAMNPLFAQEQQQLFSDWREVIQTHGLAVALATEEQLREAIHCEDGSLRPLQQFLIDRERFGRRWILESIAGPFLPLPQRLTMLVLPANAAHHDAESGVTLRIPKTTPLPDRDKLRKRLEAAIDRETGHEHLSEWSNLVSQDSQGKKTIGRHARIFQLHHFWRVLFSRHAASLRGSLKKTQAAFADYFCVSEDTIAKDLEQITKARGGSEWYLQNDVYAVL